MKVKVVQRKAKPHMLHEFNQKGQHRLVLVGEQENQTSRWYEQHEIGEFQGFMFAANARPLKFGVFRQTMVEARTLSAGSNDIALQGAKMQAQASPANRLR